MKKQLAEKVNMKHDELIKRAVTLLRQKQHKFILTEYKMIMNQEQPDCIGWDAYGVSILIECKANRADFARDARKKHRRAKYQSHAGGFGGMGQKRYYMCPKGLIRVDEIPGDWGLIYVARGIEIVKEAPRREQYDIKAELLLVLNAARRSNNYEVAPVFGPVYPKSKATKSVSDQLPLSEFPGLGATVAAGLNQLED